MKIFMVELNKKLQEAGLSSKESEIYISLLKNGPIGGGELAKIMNMDRTHAYNVLKNLVNKGLASHILKDKKTLFQANSPKDLLNQISKKELVIKSIIPELEALEKIKPKTSKVSIFEGKSGLRAIVRIILESKAKEMLVIGATGKSYEFLEYELPHLAKETASLKMTGRFITSEKLRGHQFTKLPHIKVKYIDEITPTSTLIFGNKVSINVFEENPYVILIESNSVAESYKKYFEHLWKTAR